MSNAEVLAAGLNQGVGEIIRAMYSIWGVSPNRNRGSYIFQTDAYPIVGSATANATVTGTINVTQAGAFILTKHAVYAATYDFAISWTATGSDRRVTSRANGGHVNNIGGTGQFPFIYPQAYVWDGGTTISCLVQSLTANSRSVYWDFIGWRVWDIAALDLVRRAM